MSCLSPVLSDKIMVAPVKLAQVDNVGDQDKDEKEKEE